jgi:hypothetical protein
VPNLPLGIAFCLRSHSLHLRSEQDSLVPRQSSSARPVLAPHLAPHQSSISVSTAIFWTNQDLHICPPCVVDHHGIYRHEQPHHAHQTVSTPVERLQKLPELAHSSPQLSPAPEPVTMQNATAVHTHNDSVLTRLVSRLEAATSRLEDIASSTASLDAPPASATSNGSTSAPSTAIPPAPSAQSLTPTPSSAASLPRSVEEFDALVNNDVKGYINLSQELGGSIAEQVCRTCPRPTALPYVA